MTFVEGEMSKIKSMDFDKQVKLLKAIPPMHLVLFDEDENSENTPTSWGFFR